MDLANRHCINVLPSRNVWSQVLDSTINGSSELPLCLWADLYDRAVRMDYSKSQFHLERHILTAAHNLGLHTNGNSRLNLFNIDFFCLPFAVDSWTACGVLAAGGIMAYKALEHLQFASDSVRLLLLSLWTSFVVLHAFYGGALTSFLAVSEKLPFENVVDLVTHPDWKPIVHAENKPVFEDFAVKYDSQVMRKRIQEIFSVGQQNKPLRQLLSLLSRALIRT